VVPDESSRGERGGGKLSQPSFGHGRGSKRSPLPRRDPRSDLPADVADLPALGPPFWEIVDAGLDHLGESLTNEARAAIDAQARLLLAWNEHINLTALRLPEEVARGHILDSLAALPLLRSLAANPGARGPGSRRPALRPKILDLGSGAGYPGLPIAVALPARSCALVESVRKKAAFLDVVAGAAMAAMRPPDDADGDGPDISALAERAEDLADEPDHRGAWDLVLARAVGSLAEVVELGLPLLAMGGHLVVWKADAHGTLATELAAAGRVLNAAGGSRPRVERADPTGNLGFADRRLVAVRKVRPTPDRFPRPPAERRRSALLT
jgi:16S rRNA (guanine527-N7)-methyltransferase